MKDWPLHHLCVQLRLQVIQNPEAVREMAMTGTLSRLLHKTISAEYRHREHYDPENDQRVRYVRQVIETARTGRPRADSDVVALVDHLLEEEEEAA